MTKYISRILYILPSGKIGLFLLILAFIIVSIFETFGIGIIGPYIALASNPDVINNYSFLSWVYKFFEFENKSQLVACLGLVIVVFSIIKSFVTWWIQVLIFKFGYKQQAILITRLMNGYLKAPYIFFLDKNSSQVVQNIVIETKNFTARVLIPLLISISSSFVLLCISFLLCVTNVYSVIVIIATITPLIIFFNIFKTKISQWGKNSSLAEKSLINYVNESVGSIKETKVIECESYFEDKIKRAAVTRAENMGGFYSYRQAPRYFVEALIIVFLIGFISVYLMFNNNIESLIPILSIFALSSIRIIPAANQVVGGISNLKNSTYIIDKLYFDLLEINKNTKLTTSSKSYSENISSCNHSFNKCKTHLTDTIGHKEICLESINYSYPKSSKLALKNISLTVKRGEAIALIGKSGSGKTTLVDVILGLLEPQKGDIKLDGISIYRDMKAWHNLIGYIPQSIYITDSTIEENIAFGVPKKFIDVSRLNQAVKVAQLEEFVNQLPNSTQTTVGESGTLLSGGQRQRIGIARAIYHGREILVLDEATAALDNETERLVSNAIESLNGNKTTIIIAHRLSTIQNCDRVYLLKDGQIVQSGSYDEVVSNKNLYE